MSKIEPWSTDDDSYFEVRMDGESSCGCELQRWKLLNNADEPYFAIAVIEFGEPTEYRPNAFDEVLSRVRASVNATAGISVEALEAGCIAELVEALEAWKAAQQATDDAVEHIERAAAEGWLHEPSGGGWVAESELLADAAWEKAQNLRDATLAKVKGEGNAHPRCPHGSILANPCRDCEREHREATS